MHFENIDWGSFVEVEPLARGGMAEVFLVQRLSPIGMRRPMVLKRIHQNLVRDSEIQELFINEAQIHSKLNHPNIVQIFDLGRDQNFLYMALEYMDGGDLSHLSQLIRSFDSNMQIMVGLQVFGEMASALSHVHDYGVHQDISPSNILFSKDGFFKLCDFGVAKMHGAMPIGRLKTGQGKFRYMSPEQIEGNPTDQRSDIFSLGSCMAEFFSGKQLFGHQTNESLALLLRKGAYYKEIVRLDLPLVIKDIIYRAVQPSPNDRYQSAEELLNEVLYAQSLMVQEFGAYSLKMALASQGAKSLQQSNVQVSPSLSHESRLNDQRKRPHGWAKLLSVFLSLPALFIVPFAVYLRSNQRSGDPISAGPSQRRS